MLYRICNFIQTINCTENCIQSIESIKNFYTFYRLYKTTGCI